MPVRTWYHAASSTEPDYCPHCGKEDPQSSVDHTVSRGRKLELQPSGEEKELDVWVCKRVE